MAKNSNKTFPQNYYHTHKEIVHKADV